MIENYKEIKNDFNFLNGVTVYNNYRDNGDTYNYAFTSLYNEDSIYIKNGILYSQINNKRITRFNRVRIFKSNIETTTNDAIFVVAFIQHYKQIPHTKYYTYENIFDLYNANKRDKIIEKLLK